MQDPLNKVVIIQKVTAFSSRSLSDIVSLNFVNKSWADTIQNFSFHLVEKIFLTAEDPNTACEKPFQCALKCDIIWLLNTLLSKSFLDLSKDCLVTVFRHSTSLETIKFVLGKIVEVGGNELLKLKLTATEDKTLKTFLMQLCNDCPLFRKETLELVFEKLIEVGGGSKELLKKQLVLRDKNEQQALFFMLYNHSVSPEVLDFFLDKVFEVGGAELFETMLTATDWSGLTCLLLLCSFSSADLNWKEQQREKMIKIILEKSEAIGGQQLVKRQLGAVDSNGSNCMSWLCTYAPNSEITKFIIEKSIEVGGFELFKNLFAAITYQSSCILRMCGNSSSSPEVIKYVLEKIVTFGDPEFAKNQLTATDQDKTSLLMLLCRHPSTTQETFDLVFDKIVEVGGPELLKNQFAATDSFNSCCLTDLCSKKSSSSSFTNEETTKVVKLILNKIIEVGGKEFLRDQLTSVRQFQRSICLMLVCGNPSSSPGTIELICDKLVELDNDDDSKQLLRDLLTATDREGKNCFMLLCSSSSSAEAISLLLEKIVEAGGRQLLEAQLAATDQLGVSPLMFLFTNPWVTPSMIDIVIRRISELGDSGNPPDQLIKFQLARESVSGQNLLMFLCSKLSSALVAGYIFDKIVEVGGNDFLKPLLSATSRGDPNNCTMCLCSNEVKSSPEKNEMMNLILKKIVELGGENILQKQLTASSGSNLNALQRISYNEETSEEMMKLIPSVLYHFGLFTQQYDAVDKFVKEQLKERAGIDSSAWTPDAESLAAVKALLEERDEM